MENYCNMLNPQQMEVDGKYGKMIFVLNFVMF